MKKTIRILSIDGGGIRGILPAAFLSALEGRLQEKTGNSSLRLADCFDLFAGTSTGGLLSYIYLAPARYSAKQALEFYCEYGQNAFKAKPIQGVENEEPFHKYSPEGLVAQLKLFFKDLRLSELLKPCCITAYDLLQSEPCLFNSAKAIKDKDSDYYTRDVLRATTSVPGIFPPAKISSATGMSSVYIDGSIFAHNPSFYAYIQAKELYKDATDFFLLSIGTGDVTNRYSEQTLKNDSAKNWARILSDLSFGDHKSLVDNQLREIISQKQGSKYIRVQPKLDGVNGELDDVSPANMQALYKKGQEFVSQNDHLLKELANSLRI